ncbi:MAG: HEAT repeat domain-containing protein [Planctomycetota bacterium]|nr:HEAT repeat domain-containing protein [Planctomycetota bacterium]MDA1221684.1 HEAT repeat domain-containing protein [Planctomycetota bacterium]
MQTLAVAAAVLAVLVPQDPRVSGSSRSGVRADWTRSTPRSEVYHGKDRTDALQIPVRGRVGGRGGSAEPANAAPAIQAAPQDPQRAAEDDVRFLRDLRPLQRSRSGSESRQQAILQRLGQDYSDVAARCLRLMRTEDPDMVHALMLALQFYGGPEHAGELEFQLLTRPLRSATEIVLETMAVLAREEAADRLLACLEANRSAVRHHAAVALSGRLRPEHADQILDLSRGRDVDIQLKALRLLGELPPRPEILARLVEALGEEPRCAEAAVDAFVALGPDHVADLQAILRQPALGRDFGYAALVLATLEERNPGTELVTEDMVDSMRAELDVPDAFQQGAVSAALAGLAWRSDDATGKVHADAAVVEQLVGVIAPTEFVPHLAMLSAVARPRLALLTGQDLGVDGSAWRAWWEGVQADEATFVGARSRVACTVVEAPRATLTWRTPGRELVLRGPETGAPAAVECYVVGPEELASIVADLERLGFMRGHEPGRSAPDLRSLELEVGGLRVRSDPDTIPAILDRFAARIGRTTSAETWQRYRDPLSEPDPVGLWLRESAWLAEHPETADRAARLKDRILGTLASPGAADRAAEAVADLLAIEGIDGLLTPEDGARLVDAAAAMPDWNGPTFRLLEIALLAPGEDTWPRILTVAAERDERTGSGSLLRLFGLAGPDRVLSALESESVAVRLAAIDEVSRLLDLRAAPRLVACASSADEPLELRRAAVYALGRMRARDASAPLQDMLADDALDTGLRRTTWVALARIVGDGALPILRDAGLSPDPADRRTIVEALGAMGTASAARELATIFSLAGEDVLGSLALGELRRLGDRIASPVLVPLLDARDEGVRSAAALQLGDFQHPAAFPELYLMLQEDDSRLRIMAAIAGITGQNVTDRNDRLEHLSSWYADNRSKSQGDWLIAALNENGITHRLTPAELVPEAGVACIPELTRLIVECEQPWLRSLAARLLRVATSEDQGTLPPLADEAQRLAYCERYRFLYEAARASGGR